MALDRLHVLTSLGLALVVAGIASPVALAGVTTTPRPAGSAVAVAGKNETRTARHLDAIRGDPVRLRSFLLGMPKGGDLHNHLSGAVPTEALIGYAVADGLCIDTITLTASPPPAVGVPGCPLGQRPAADSSTDGAFYQQILRAWSMEGFVAGTESGHDHFFATFGKFSWATARKGDMLAAVAEINASQRVYYLETLVSRQSDAVRALALQAGFEPNLAALRARLLARGMAEIVKAARTETDADLARFAQLLGCGTPRARPGCSLALRFDHQVGRATSPEIVFANLLLGFELQRADRRYVGVNLVQPEDNPIALRDYTLHMRMVRFLRSVYPRAHVTLHAGELAPGLVTPEHLRFHIRQAVEIAGAGRIGHGVDLMQETDPGRLLRVMRRRDVLVEVPLTSNRQILGVTGSRHPFPRYRAAGVPVALATDDPGVSRIDLTGEYAYALTEYDLRYRDLKTLARDSLEYAFLRGRSMWTRRGGRRAGSRRTAECRRDVPGLRRLTPRCRTFLRLNPKAAVQWAQEGDFNRFERRRRAPLR